VTPDRSWLREIATAAVSHPEICVFGGRVDVAWPDGRQPEWASAGWVKSFGYSWHDHGDAETYYTPPACPFGPNFWVRRSVFDVVPGFDESIGPRPKGRIMGSETSFLMLLQRHGLRMLYCPGVRVQHRVTPSQCTPAYLRRRGYGFGRSEVRLFGMRRSRLYASSRLMWWIVAAADVAYNGARLCAGFLMRSARRRCETTVDAIINLGSLMESVSSAGQALRSVRP
jgi:hypothetical protein